MRGSLRFTKSHMKFEPVKRRRKNGPRIIDFADFDDELDEALAHFVAL